MFEKVLVLAKELNKRMAKQLVQMLPVCAVEMDVQLIVLLILLDAQSSTYPTGCTAHGQNSARPGQRTARSHDSDVQQAGIPWRIVRFRCLFSTAHPGPGT